MRARIVRCLGLLLLIVPPAPTQAEPAARMPAPQPEQPATPVSLRTGVHDGYGRLVFDLPPGQTGVMTQEGAVVTLRFTSPGMPAIPHGLPHNVVAMRADAAMVTLTLAPNVRLRTSRLGDRLVLDLLDPPPLAAVPDATVPAAPPGPGAGSVAVPRRSATRPDPMPSGGPADSRPTQRSRPSASAPASSLAAPLEAVSAVPLAAPTGREPIVAAVAPVLSVANTPVALAPGRDEAGTLRLPFSSETGAAAFRLGDEAVLVFDERRPIDTARLRDDPIFHDLAVQMLPGGTMLRLGLPAGRAIQMLRSPGGWDVTVASGPVPMQPIGPLPIDGGLRLPAAEPGRVVSVPNPQTGAVLLVGTQRRSGQGIAVARANPVLMLLPTWQGVVVDPAVDALTLRAAPDGFVVAADRPTRALPLAAADPDAGTMVDGTALTRRFDLPSLSVDALRWRLREATMQAAAAPAQGRTRQRLLVGQTMVALGLGAEAQALLAVTVADDPGSVDNPDMVGLSAIAALLAGRIAEADGLDDPRLSGSDEIGLWRAVRSAMRDEAPSAAAPGLAATLPLLLTYPPPLRARLLRLAAETMALGGEPQAAARLVAARPDDASLAFTRGILADLGARSGGDPAAALAIYDGLAAGKDRLIRLRAALAATELRLFAGQMSPGQAADAMEHLIPAWRGDEREIRSRLRVAELDGQAGNWRRSMAGLREAALLSPDRQPPIRELLIDTFARAIRDDPAHPAPALDLVTLIEENTDLLPNGEAGAKLAARLAERLLALDLPERAIATLARLMAATPPGVARAEIGRNLAGLQLRQHDPTAARATLDGSRSADLPPEAADARGLLAARVDVAQGDVPAALARLDRIDTAASDELRATLLEAANDWPGATAALSRYAARALPGAGALDTQQGQLVLRFAAAAARAGDEAALARLRAETEARMPNADMTHLLVALTEPPVRVSEDLPRAAREAALARTVPSALKTLSMPGPRPMAAR